ncbi:MAG: hypothetical protein O8C62_03145 [Candidatus Methanoperedens sp.]|nr:hypothetical protein [Candidatus Methanoperedens sp.]
MNKDPEDLKLSYILSIFIMVAGLFWYIVSDIFSKAKLTLYPQIQFLILIDLIIFTILIIILLSFLSYLFLEGLRFTDNDYLKSLSEKYSNRFYTAGFEASLVFIPLAILAIISYRNNLILTTLFAVIVLIYFYKFVFPWIKYPEISKLFISMVLYIILFLLIVSLFQSNTSDIRINFDKQYYHSDDYVVITIDQSGITYPNINDIKINGRSVKSENLFTSDEGIKKIAIYNIDKVKESLVFKDNYNITIVEVDYSIPYFLTYSISTSKFSSFIVLSNPLEFSENQLNQSNGHFIVPEYQNTANTSDTTNNQTINSEYQKDSFSLIDWSTVIGIVIGVIVGVIASVIGQAVYGYFYKPDIKIFGEAAPHSSETIARHRIKVENIGKSTAEDCVGYITIDNAEKEDVFNLSGGPGESAFINTPENFTPIIDEGLCWSFNERGKINPHYLSIFPKTHKLLELYHVERRGKELYIKIPSELGWSIFRVKLKEKVYIGTLKIAARNVKYDRNKHAKKFRLVPSRENRDVILEFFDC